MDFAPDAATAAAVAGVSTVATRHGGLPALRAASSAGRFLVELDDHLATVVAPEASLLERLLVVDEAARLGLPALPGPRLLVAPEALGRWPDGPFAVADRRRPGPVRIPPGGATVLVLDGDGGGSTTCSIATDATTMVPVASSFGFPFAELAIAGASPLPEEAITLLLARWHLCLAAELAGTARGALEHLATHLRERSQFGVPLATFQALRHRVAELAVSSEAATWMARQAAFHGDAERAGVAVAYARELAARMVPELVQISGARGFTLEFPVQLLAMRLEGLRLMVGSADRLARDVLPMAGAAR